MHSAIRGAIILPGRFAMRLMRNNLFRLFGQDMQRDPRFKKVSWYFSFGKQRDLQAGYLYMLLTVLSELWNLNSGEVEQKVLQELKCRGQIPLAIPCRIIRLHSLLAIISLQHGIR
jgi:hypothetical protein